MIKYAREPYGQLEVVYTSHLDGGGRDFGQLLVKFVEERIGYAERLLEWCCGPGFIGFSSLARGLCGELTLADINEEATMVCRKTVRENQLDNSVTVLESDCFDSVTPEMRWDLVVGNPPHRGGPYIEPRLGPSILYIDRDWNSHRKFFGQVSDHLNPGGNVLLIESRGWSTADEFRKMAEGNGLEWVGEFPADENFYIVWARRA